MMKTKNFYSLVLALCLMALSSTATYAQSGKLERAKRYMKELNYIGAIEVYNSILAKGDNAEAKINLAECYRKVSDSENAEFLYGQVVRLPEVQPVHFLYYGEMLQRNGKCDAAKEWYKKFSDAVPEDVRGQYLNKACDYQQELLEKGKDVYEVARATFNSNFDDFGATPYKDGIIFASERDKGAAVKRNHSWTGNPFLDLYYVPVKKSGDALSYGRPEKFDSEINSKYHDAIVTFSSDQSTMFFTRNNKTGKDDEGVMKLKIYSVKAKGKNSWTAEESLPFNSDEYSVAHPSLNADGTKLYFASDMPGGFGGMDLYVSDYESGRWGPPTNLGPVINTEGNELFPNITEKGKLFYSSDGQLGLGGLDIFYVEPKDGNNNWSTPENLGAPINSKDDDFEIIWSKDGKSGFFSSDRQGGSGRDDVYSFIKTAAPLEVLVIDEETKLPIEGATVVDSCSKRMVKTNKLGKATFDVKFGACCTFSASMEKYDPNAKEGCIRDSTVERDSIVIPLKKTLQFMLAGVVLDQSTGVALEGAKVTLTNTCGDSTQTATTDATGKFSFKLKKDCCYKLKGEKDKYFANTVEGDTLCTKDLKESKTLMANIYLQPTTATPNNPNGGLAGNNITPNGTQGNPSPGTPKTVYYDPGMGQYIDPKTGKHANGTHDGIAYKDGQIADGRMFTPTNTTYTDGSQGYLLHIYYDFDQAYLRDESKPELEKLLTLLKENPNYIIELGSHTDARGSNNYNNRLSQRRAESVVRWLVEHGIERDRLVPRGYGESKTVNQCVNKVPCSEKEHQLNRRTEFRVMGCKGCIDEGAAKLSRPNDNPKVDKCVGCPF